MLDTAGTSYSLQASENGLTTTASPMSVTSAPATRLVVTIPPPGTMIAGSAFGLTVSAEDAYGNLATTFDDNVSVALVAAPVGSALGGTTIVTAAQGVATFTGLALDTVGTDYSLEIESGSLTATVSGISVNPGSGRRAGRDDATPAVDGAPAPASG